MANRCIRWQMMDHGILAGKTFAQQSFETALRIMVIVPVEKIPAHLVHHDPHHELWTGNGLSVTISLFYLGDSQDGMQQKIKKQYTFCLHGSWLQMAFCLKYISFATILLPLYLTIILLSYG